MGTVGQRSETEEVKAWRCLRYRQFNLEFRKLASIDRDPNAEFGQSNNKDPLKGMGIAVRQ